MWLMPRASREGRGGDSGNAFNNVVSKSSRVFTAEELKQITQERLKDPDIAHWSDFVHYYIIKIVTNYGWITY